jgi:hypothetical protein
MCCTLSRSSFTSRLSDPVEVDLRAEIRSSTDLKSSKKITSAVHLKIKAI